MGVSWYLYPLSAVLIGSTQRALANLLHEASHKKLARNQRLNLLLGTIASGYLVLHLYTPYRNAHIGYHHRYLGDPERDPDYAFHVECGLYDSRQSDLVFFGKNILLALFGFRTIQYVRYIIGDRIFGALPPAKVSMPISPRVERLVLLAEWAVIGAVAAATGTAHLLLLFWFVPIFTTAIAIGWLAELAEHYPLPESESRQILMTRNRHGRAVENFLLGRHYDNYHLVHHLNTGIPFWNMRRAHRVLLDDPLYAAWDGMWAGVLTRGRGGKDRETLTSYASKYRAWRRAGGDPQAASVTFATAMLLRHTESDGDR
ncbi:fatty acid desaturase family protein [Micromonospora sp. CPCC 205371]|nr:fatty acid desaturase family protein [Micromonospora sp. CPCC 205371]